MNASRNQVAAQTVRVKGSSQRLGIQVIARAGAVLRALQDSRTHLSLGDLAKIVKLPRSTVQRIVDALDREGLVIAASASSGVRLGPALLSLAKAAQFEIADLMRPALRQLARTTGETVDLVVMGQNKLVFVDQIEGRHRLRAVSPGELMIPLHCSASGKAMLAALSEEELQQVRKTLKLTAETKNTITNWKQLDRELETIRKMGVALDREEHELGVSAAAMAFRGPTNELAAVSILVPTQRFKEDEKKILQKLQQCLRSQLVTDALR